MIVIRSAVIDINITVVYEFVFSHASYKEGEIEDESRFWRIC